MKLITKLLCFSFLILLLGVEAQVKPIQTQKVNDQLYVYQTYNYFEGVEYSANGMFLVTSKGVVMFDVPWQHSQYQEMINLFKTQFNLPLIAVFVTHSHDDRAGDLSFFKSKNVPTYATKETNELLKKEGKTTSEFEINTGKTYRFGQEKFIPEFFGEGHTSDNITIWFPKYKVLDGGCLVKSSTATNLGYIGEANVKAWPATIENITKKHKIINLVIPGHDDWQHQGHLENTLKLLKNNNGSK